MIRNTSKQIEILKLLAEGEKVADISYKLKVTAAYIYYIIKKQNNEQSK